MKARSVALLSVLGMTLTSLSVWSLTPGAGPGASVTEPAAGGTGEAAPAPDRATFSAAGTLAVEGRVGHARVVRGEGKTFVMVEVHAGDGLAGAAEPASLALVIDRSGSMKGGRLENAKNAAIAAVDRMRDGDTVSVVAFDDAARTVLAPTAIAPGARERIAAAIRGITLGGDTCISCGLEEAMSHLGGGGRVRRMLVLSDGHVTAGVRDVPGMRRMAARARDRGVDVTTIGVDLDYDEVMLSAIAQEGNGRHYFVQDDASLRRAFEEEARIATSAVAGDVEVSIELARGVELARVVDRSSRRTGSGVVVSLGSFTAGQTKTVLLEVKLPRDAAGDGVELARVGVGYRDLAGGGGPARAEGVLGVGLVDAVADASPLDPVVATRLQRSETASVLESASTLALDGRVTEAKRKLEEQARNLEVASGDVARAAPSAEARALDDDLKRQIAAVQGASSGFAPRAPAAKPAPPTHADRVNGKRSVEASNPFRD